MHARTSLAAVAVAVALASCASAPKPAAATGPFVVPAGGERFLAFETGRYTAEGTQHATPAGAGAVRGAAFDLEGGRACVAYENQWGFVRLGSGSLEWIPMPAALGPGAVSLRDGLACAVSGTSIRVVGVPDGTPIFSGDAGKWLAEEGIDELVYGLALDENTLALVLHDEGGITSGGDTVVDVLDISQGSWRSKRRSEVVGLQTPHRCTSAGTDIFVAGVYGVVQNVAGTNAGKYHERLVICRVDPVGGFSEEVVWEALHVNGRVVQALAAGEGLVAVLLDGGELRVYRLQESGRTSAPVYSKHFGSATSVAWLDDSMLVVHTAQGPEAVRLNL